MNQPPRQPWEQQQPPQHAPLPGGYGMGGPLVQYRQPSASTVPEAARPNAGILGFHLLSALSLPIGFVVGIALMIAGGIGSEPGGSPGALFFVGVGLLCLGFLGMMVSSILRMVWYYQIWSWIPPSHRTTKSWASGMSPAFAALGHLIPYFNIYWNFAAGWATCDALDMLSAQYTPGRQSPRGTATAMAITSLLFFPVAPILSHVFMRDVGRLAEQIDDERTRTGALGPQF